MNTTQPTTWYQATWTEDNTPCEFRMAGDRVLVRILGGASVMSMPLQQAKVDLRSTRDAQGRPVPVAGQATQPALPLASKPTPVALPTPGTYTVEHADHTYETIRIRNHWDSSRADELVVEFLSGPDNDNDYKGFAFLLPGGVIRTWKKYTTDGHTPSPAMSRWVAATNVLIQGDRLAMAEAYATRSSRCSRCNRTLTVPASIHHGYGPECWQIVNP